MTCKVSSGTLNLAQSIFPLPRSGPSYPAKGVGEALLAPARGQQHLQPPDAFSGLYVHQKSQTANAFLGVFRAPGTCLVLHNVVLFLLNEI